MDDYYSSVSNNVDQEHFTLCGSLQPGIQNQESSNYAINLGYASPFTTGYGPPPFDTNTRNNFGATFTGDIATIESEYWDQGRPKTEYFRHGNFRLNLPIRTTFDAPILHKQAILANTVSRIANADGTFFEKYDALRTRLEPICPDAELKKQMDKSYLSEAKTT